MKSWGDIALKGQIEILDVVDTGKVWSCFSWHMGGSVHFSDF